MHNMQMFRMAADWMKPLVIRDEIRFYERHEPYYEFTNFYKTEIFVDGITYPTSEHFFQAQKFVDHPKLMIICAECDTPREALEFSRRHKNRVVSNWYDGGRDTAMLRAVREKFAQHEELKRKLLSTENKKLVEHTSMDRYWADGGDGRGRNRLGEILMQVRSELRGNKQQSPRRNYDDKYRSCGF